MGADIKALREAAAQGSSYTAAQNSFNAHGAAGETALEEALAAAAGDSAETAVIEDAKSAFHDYRESGDALFGLEPGMWPVAATWTTQQLGPQAQQAPSPIRKAR